MKASRWELYDEMIEGVDPNFVVSDFLIGSGWSMVSAGGSIGISLAVKDRCLPFGHNGPIIGEKLRDVAALCKSWNFSEASLGTAALNCYYNDYRRISSLGLIPADGHGESKNAFIEFAGDVRGKKVCVIGHFPHIERQFADICDLTILERRQEKGDYPDSACEFILPEQDLVFITGMTFTNKTIVRLLEIIPKTTKVSMVGPSVPCCETLFERNVDNLSAFSVSRPDELARRLRLGVHAIFQSGAMISYDKPDCYLDADSRSAANIAENPRIQALT